MKRTTIPLSTVQISCPVHSGVLVISLPVALVILLPVTAAEETFEGTIKLRLRPGPLSRRENCIPRVQRGSAVVGSSTTGDGSELLGTISWLLLSMASGLPMSFVRRRCLYGPGDCAPRSVSMIVRLLALEDISTLLW